MAQNVIRTGKADFVGLGRMVLTYPELCADVLEGKPLQRKRICRTFSDCTTAPRKGLVSGCYPLDEFYKQRPEAEQLRPTRAVNAKTPSGKDAARQGRNQGQRGVNAETQRNADKR